MSKDLYKSIMGIFQGKKLSNTEKIKSPLDESMRSNLFSVI